MQNKLQHNSGAASAAVVYGEEIKPYVNTDPRAYTRIGWSIVIAGVCGFLLWAFLAPLDKGVPLSGT
ncbi:MAG TPA: hypothetical protein VGP12_08530, partial [Nitrosospira sp.]|nr:hypothetical protein [Nitrosospira sp.]